MVESDVGEYLTIIGCSDILMIVFGRNIAIDHEKSALISCNSIYDI